MGLMDGEQLPMWLQDPWDAIMEHLGEARMPLGDHFENLTYCGRLLLSLRIALDALVGKEVANVMKIILHLPAEYVDVITERY